ncbi:MAG: DUF3552 domain-containing protein, partial [Bacteroidetes bacterium]|nr:DUF3552 domain-containing protein [Bacteroidota bacterium]
MELVIGVIVGLIIGFGGAWMISNNLLKTRKESLISEATKEGETIKEKKILQAKERFLELKSQHEKEVHERNNKVKQSEDRIRNREKELAQQTENLKKKDKEIEQQRETLNKQLEVTQKKQQDLEKNSQKAIALLEDISKMTAQQAKDALMEQLKDDARNSAAGQIQSIVDEAKVKANQEAKKIVIQTIQRTAVEHAV